jgi:hypothetical protein
MSEPDSAKQPPTESKKEEQPKAAEPAPTESPKKDDPALEPKVEVVQDTSKISASPNPGEPSIQQESPKVTANDNPLASDSSPIQNSATESKEVKAAATEPPQQKEEIKQEPAKVEADKENAEESDPENLIKPSDYIDELDKEKIIPTNNPNDDDIINVKL